MKRISSKYVLYKLSQAFRCEIHSDSNFWLCKTEDTWKGENLDEIDELKLVEFVCYIIAI